MFEARFLSVPQGFDGERPVSASQRHHAGETKQRLLDAAELLFIERGYEGMSLRQITAQADANLAAVNYHFGSKDALIHAVLSRRLIRLNQERLALLDACQASQPQALDCKTLLAILFAPALRIGRDPALGGPAFIRLLGRIYSDASPFIQGYLQEHYRPIFERFFNAFAAALPQLSRNELGLRLHFALKSVAGLLAGDELEQLIAELSMGETLPEAEVLGRLVSLLAATITAPFANAEETARIAQVLRLAHGAAHATDAQLERDRQASRPAPLPFWPQGV